MGKVLWKIMLMEIKIFKIIFVLEWLIINLRYKVVCDKYCMSGIKEVSKYVYDIKVIFFWG